MGVMNFVISLVRCPVWLYCRMHELSLSATSFV